MAPANKLPDLPEVTVTSAFHPPGNKLLGKAPWRSPNRSSYHPSRCGGEGFGWLPILPVRSELTLRRPDLIGSTRNCLGTDVQIVDPTLVADTGQFQGFIESANTVSVKGTAHLKVGNPSRRVF